MPPASKEAPERSDADLRAQRDALRRGLRRSNAASVLILMLLVALAFGFVWKARQTAREAERANEHARRANAEADRARQASARAEGELWNARLNEARARRIAGGPGARIGATAILHELVRRPDLTEGQRLALRQEAIAQLGLVDVTPATTWIENPSFTARSWDGSLTRYVRHNSVGKVDVCEYPSDRVLASFQGPSNAPPRVSIFTPDGELLVTRFSGSDVLVWKLKTGALFLKSRCQPVDGLNRPLLPSPDSRSLAMFTDRGLMIQPLETNGTPRLLQPGRAVVNAVFTRDARKLAVLLAKEQNIVEVWDAASGATLQRFDVGFPVWTFEWHPDGRRLAVSGNHGLLGIWDVTPTLFSLLSTNIRSSVTDANAPQEMLRLEGHTGAVDYTMFTPDGSCLLTHAYDKTSILWDVISGQRLLAETRMTLNDFDSGGKRVVGWSSNNLQEAICAFHPRTGFRTVAWVGGPRAINGIWLTPDSRLLVIAHPVTQGKPRGECRLWDFERGVEIARLPGIWAQFSRDGRFLFTFEMDVLRRYELGSGLLAGAADSLHGEILLKMGRGDSANAGTLSADGRFLALGAVNHVKLVDLETKSVSRQFNALTHDAELSPDGTLLGTRFHTQLGCLRNPTNGAVLTQMVGVVEFVFSPDNKWILARGVDKLRLLDKSLAVVREVPLEVGVGFPPSTAFSPDGTTLAVVHNRFDVRLLDLASGLELATLSSPRPAQVAWSHGLTFSHDGRSLVVAKENGEIVTWDLPVIRAELAKLGLDWGVDSPARPPAHSEDLNPNRNPALGPSNMLESEITKRTADAFVLSTLAPALPPSRGGPANITSRADLLGSPALTTAFGAVALALAAGLFVSLHQRRVLSAYVHAEALNVEQQRKLQTAQEELQHSQKMRSLGTLAAGIAHDFNNLLSVIRLSNQLAAEQTKAVGAAKENMEAIESAVAQGETIVQSMLGYSRAAGEFENEYSISAAISETVAMLGKKFLSGIVLKLEVQPDIPPVRGVRGRLEQVLLNLVVNASEAMNGKGTLQITAHVLADDSGFILKPRPASRYVSVNVSDSGPGISPDILPRIFDPFFTTKNAGARPGTGLGLSTVYTMAQQDGLGLAVETSQGAGTTFRILVPIIEAARELVLRAQMDERNMPSAPSLRTG